MVISLGTWRCKSCDHVFGPNEPQHKVWYEEDDSGKVTPHDAQGIPQDVRELLRDMKRGVPAVRVTVGPRYYCDDCIRHRFPSMELTGFGGHFRVPAGGSEYGQVQVKMG